MAGAPYQWSDTSRGAPLADHVYAQVLTPVNLNDPVEVARWNTQHPADKILLEASPNSGPLPDDEEDFLERAMAWVKANPLLAAGGAALVLVLMNQAGQSPFKKKGLF